MSLLQFFYSRRLDSLLISFLLSLLLRMPAGAQDLNVYVTASDEVVGPEDRTTYTVTVANPSTADLADVAVEIQLPDEINTFGTPPNFNCGSSNCNPGETVTWSVGALDAGDSRSVFFRTFIDDSAPDGLITATARASAPGVPDAMATLDVEVDSSPLLRLSLTPESGPAVPGEAFTYTLTYGNIGDDNPTNVVLTMPVPAGTTFLSATSGGTVAGGTVTWNLGLVGIGSSGQVQVTVTPDAALNDGSIVQTAAEMDPNESGAPTARSSTTTPVHSDVPLHLEYGISQTTGQPDDQLIYTITATNTGPAPLTDVSARLLLPGFVNTFGPPPNVNCGSSRCNANEIVTWSVGTLDAGQSTTTYYHTFVGNAAPQGELLRSLLTATASGSKQVTASMDAQVDPSPLLRLSMIPEARSAIVGEPLTYLLTLGNTGTQNPTGVALHMSAPEGTSFESATKGTISGETFTWNVGALGIGASTYVRLTVMPDGETAAGDLIRARAELDSGESNEVIVRTAVVTPVRETDDLPLHLRYSINQTALGQNDGLDVSLSATNTAPFEISNVRARMLLPDFIDTFGPPPNVNCGSSRCNPGEIVTWDVGTLSSGESRTIVFRTFLRDGSSGAPAGEVLRSMLTADGDGTEQILGNFVVQVDPSPLLRLSLASSAQPVAPGENLVYTISASNVGTKNPSNALLTLPLPDNTTVVSATDGGSINGNVITWDIDDILSSDVAGQAEVIVQVENGLPNGSLITAEATLDSGESSEIVIRSVSTTAVRTGVPLVATYSAAQTAAAADESITYTLTVENTGGGNLANASARILLPGFIDTFGPPSNFDCGSSLCNPNEIVTWEIGTLEAGQDRRATFEPTVHSSVSPGELLRSVIVITAAGTNEVILETDVLTPDDTALPVDLASFAATATGPSVALRWATAAETNNAGFDIERSSDGMSFTRIGFANGHGTTTETHSYRFADVDLPFADTLFYRLRQIDLDGASDYSPVVTVSRMPTQVALLPNAPNPVRTTTRLRYILPARAAVSLQVYDLLGRRVATLVNAEQPKGRHTVTLDGTPLAPGIYFARLQSGSETHTQRIAVVR